ncbi:MAG: hypothetical protein QGH20_05070 [Candidatus Latescibacteria bacterium]|jgi:O-phosphoseryl-tRNA(Cys) synthetase|nr:hypothetical protein [Candidatus Latescibacterota bacterium]
MKVQRFFTTYPPTSDAFPEIEIIEADAKTITVRGEEVSGWIMTVASDEDHVHPMSSIVEDGE